MLMLGARFKVMVAVLAVGTLVGGFASLGDSLRYSNPKHLVYSKFVQEQPHQGYFVVHGGSLDLTSAVLPFQSADGYMVPLRDSSETPDTPVHVLVYITDESLVRKIDAYNDSMHKDETLWAMTHQSQLGTPPTVTTIPATIAGMVNYSLSAGMGENEKGTEKIKYDGELVTITKDAHPNALKAIGLIIAGFSLCLYSLQSFGIEFDLSGFTSLGRKRPDESEIIVPEPSGVHPDFRLAPGQQAPKQNAPVPDEFVYTAKPPTEFLSAEPETKKTKEEEELDRIRAIKPYDPFA